MKESIRNAFRSAFNAKRYLESRNGYVANYLASALIK